LLLGFVTAVLMAVPAPAAAQEGDEPQLNISIDNGQTSVDIDDELVYTVTVRNVGTAAVAALEVTQTVPPGLRFESADGEGLEEGGAVRWVVDLPPDGEATLHSTLTVTTTPDELLRLATTACAGPSDAERPLVCATHSDELPAGARAAALDAEPAPDDPSSGRRAWLVAGVGVAAVLAVLVVVLRGRRVARARRRAHARP
jgi:uncharacterized repeat protein (TIGR01451 family)